MRSPGLFRVAFVMGLSLANVAIGFAQPGGPSMTTPRKDFEKTAASADHGTKPAIKDGDITEAVRLALQHDTLTKGSDIHVKTEDGVVTLWGTVLSSGVAARAEKLTHDTAGVRSVRDDLKVINTSNTG
jgi:hypothetical protein